MYSNYIKSCGTQIKTFKALEREVRLHKGNCFNYEVQEHFLR